jgi:hypothetical protein
MTTLTGAFSIEIEIDRLAERIAMRVAELLAGEHRDVHDREDPEGTAAVPEGVEGFGVGGRIPDQEPRRPKLLRRPTNEADDPR